MSLFPFFFFFSASAFPTQETWLQKNKACISKVHVVDGHHIPTVGLIAHSVGLLIIALSKIFPLNYRNCAILRINYGCLMQELETTLYHSKRGNKNIWGRILFGNERCSLKTKIYAVPINSMKCVYASFNHYYSQGKFDRRGGFYGWVFPLATTRVFSLMFGRCIKRIKTLKHMYVYQASEIIE